MGSKAGDPELIKFRNLFLSFRRQKSVTKGIERSLNQVLRNQQTIRGNFLHINHTAWYVKHNLTEIIRKTSQIATDRFLACNKKSSQNIQVMISR